jgi:predicted RNA-binding protein with PUA-like domain
MTEKVIFEKTPIKNSKIWIFQANPARFDILAALSNPVLVNQVWLVNQYKNQIQCGDIALIWIAGKKAGIYAIAEITSDPVFMVESSEEEKYWVREIDKKQSRLRVNVKIVKRIIDSPLLRKELKVTAGLTQLSILRFSQRSNFPVSQNEWEIIKRIIIADSMCDKI